MQKHDDISTRMKMFYEVRSQTYLTRRVPVIIRADGRAFHTFCKRFKKPYDEHLNGCLNNTLKSLCSKVQCVKMGQRHSDELSLLLIDYDALQTEPFFDYNVQKMCSVVAAMATAEFCRQLIYLKNQVWQVGNLLFEIENWPVFDCRCFNIPEKEISNYVWCRLLDCKRSSINMMAQSLFSHAQLQNKTCNEMQEMMFQEKGINWDSLPQEQKSGVLCLRKDVEKPVEKGPDAGKVCIRSVWSTEPAPKLKSDLDAILKNILEFSELSGLKE